MEGIADSGSAGRMRVQCFTCGGLGDLQVPRAYLNSAAKRIEPRYVIEECWFCGGEGWMNFGRRRQLIRQTCSRECARSPARTGGGRLPIVPDEE